MTNFLDEEFGIKLALAGLIVISTVGVVLVIIGLVNAFQGFQF